MDEQKGTTTTASTMGSVTAAQSSLLHSSRPLASSTKDSTQSAAPDDEPVQVLLKHLPQKQQPSDCKCFCFWPSSSKQGVNFKKFNLFCGVQLNCNINMWAVRWQRVILFWTSKNSRLDYSFVCVFKITKTTFRIAT